MNLKTFYLIMAALGTIIPWLFFGSFIAENGLNVLGFITSLFNNPAAGGFSADVLISLFVFWVWSYNDAKKLNILKWWYVLPAGFCVGLSLAMPLYLYLREKSDQK